MFTNKSDKRLRIGLPIHWESFEVFEHCSYTCSAEKGDGIFCVLIEVCIEDALIHEVGFAVDRKEHPAQVVQLEWSEDVGLSGHGLFDVLRVFVKDGLAAGNNLRENAEPVARR